MTIYIIFRTYWRPRCKFPVLTGVTVFGDLLWLSEILFMFSAIMINSIQMSFGQFGKMKWLLQYWMDCPIVKGFSWISIITNSFYYCHTTEKVPSQIIFRKSADIFLENVSKKLVNSPSVNAFYCPTITDGTINLTQKDLYNVLLGWDYCTSCMY